MARTTLKDIASIAKVSLTAVSLVINDKPMRITQEKRDEIKRIAKELNYIPNHSARQLANNESKTIGLIIPDLENIFFSSFVKKIQEACFKKGYFVLVANTNDDYHNDLVLIDMLISKGVDAIIISPSNDAIKNETEYLDFLNRIPLPYVVVDRVFDDLKANSVSFDNELGMYLATKSIIHNNHRKIAFINGDSGASNHRSRFNGFKKALSEEKIHLSKKSVFDGSYTFDCGYQMFSEIMASNIKYTAIVAANDMIAFGVMKRADEMGVSIPDDISVVGYDNLVFSSMLNVPLSTVHQNIDQFVFETVRVLFNLINNKAIKENVILEPKLIERKSVKNIS